LRILFVGMPGSVHTARWINQISDLGWDLHLFASTPDPPHSKLRNITVYAPSFARPPALDRSVRLRGLSPLTIGAERLGQRVLNATWLSRIIRRVKPDLIHALETQRAGYMTGDAKARTKGAFPRFMLSAWGNDLYLFGRLPDHAARIRATLEQCNFFTADCDRDIEVVREFGFTGKTFPALPGSGGLDIETAKKLQSSIPPSQRRTVTLKGYQNWAGRALDGMRALELCADVLQDYRIVIYFANEDVAIAAQLMSQRIGIPVDVVPRASYEESLRMHARARVSVGVSISDGLPLSTVESALMGAFPVQTNTSCAGERFRDGAGILLVSPDDINAIAAAIRRALTDDELVDRAAEMNFDYISRNLSIEAVKPQVVTMYRQILGGALT
jgi:hypothetical protein